MDRNWQLVDINDKTTKDFSSWDQGFLSTYTFIFYLDVNISMTILVVIVDQGTGTLLFCPDRWLVDISDVNISG